MNKIPSGCKVVFLPTLLAFTLLLSSSSVACFPPSLAEMSKGRAMDCCTKHCRMETTPRAAQEACQQTSQAFNQQETISSPSGIPALTTLKPLPDLGFHQKINSTLLEPIHHSHNIIVERGPHGRYRTVEIYTFAHSFLI